MPDRLQPPRAITRGAHPHWFGYYDKLQFGPRGRRVLGLAGGFEGRMPAPGDRVRIGMVDLADATPAAGWTTLADTSAWCWQQGCMLQWLPGSEHEIIYNDREGGRFVSRIVNVATSTARTLPAAIYCVAPSGRWALGLDFARTGRLRPGYGYPADEATAGEAAPEASGIYRLDLATGDVEPIISLAQIAAIDSPHYDGRGMENWFNHLLVSPDGSRFIFLHRWDATGPAGPKTRLFTAAPDGTDLRMLTDAGASHFIWRDPGHLHAWARLRPDDEWAHLLFDEATGHPERVGKPDRLTHNGHMTYLPGGEWILNDHACGRDATRHRTKLYLYHVPTDRRVDLADVWHDNRHAGPMRCDLHPRASRDGRRVCFDSAHEGTRQMYLVDIADVVG